MSNKGNGGLILLLIIALGWSIFFHKDKYEDRNAEEWFSKYTNTVASLITTRNELEGMENESTLKECIEKNDELTRTILKGFCKQYGGDNCLQTMVNHPGISNVMASNKESRYTCFEEYLENL